LSVPNRTKRALITVQTLKKSKTNWVKLVEKKGHNRERARKERDNQQIKKGEEGKGYIIWNKRKKAEV